MKRRWQLLGWLAMGACVFADFHPTKAAAKAPDHGQIRSYPEQSVFGYSEYFLRKRLTNSPKPEYPKAALESGTHGQVTMFVWFDNEGKLVEATTLISPDESLSEAVTSALKDWRIKPSAPNFPDSNYWSEVRFVFSIKDGKGEVSDVSTQEQRKVSDEFTREVSRRKNGASK